MEPKDDVPAHSGFSPVSPSPCQADLSQVLYDIQPTAGESTASLGTGRAWNLLRTETSLSLSPSGQGATQRRKLSNGPYEALYLLTRSTRTVCLGKHKVMHV